MRDAAGRKLARAEAPAPGGGASRVALRTGSIGSVGTLLEVEAASGESVCRTVWRFRDGALSRLPLLDDGGALPDCEPAATWTTRFDESRNEPARYLRERDAEVPDGRLHEARAYVWSGFEMKRDPKRSSAELNGVAIPDWPDAAMYPKTQLDALSRRYGVGGVGKAPRLRFVASRERGEFAVLLSDGDAERRLPVKSAKSVDAPEPTLDLSAGDPPVELRVTLAGSATPRDVSVRGAGPRLDGGYGPVIRWDPTRVRMYASAEQELAHEALPGTWSTDRGERLVVAAGAAGDSVRIDGAELAVRFPGAPEGTDVLLVPSGAAAPAWAVAFRGPDAFTRVRVSCAGAAGSRECRAEGEPQAFRRVGSQLNARGG
jgi:hypothetical protein